MFLEKLILKVALLRILVKFKNSIRARINEGSIFLFSLSFLFSSTKVHGRPFSRKKVENGVAGR